MVNNIVEKRDSEEVYKAHQVKKYYKTIYKEMAGPFSVFFCK